MSKLQFTARFTIQDGKLDEFKGLATACMNIVRTQDTGTLQYDWFLSADGSECVVRETYRDSAAVLEHAANVGEYVPQFLAISDAEFEVFGSPTPELVEALSGLAPRVYAPFQAI